ncbi:hypothetical protein CTAYLR_002146 [Chrysophaeum taylorii]|uniref:Uncharacterized protein n=1 Tax=Chrysophaeum taylorii TaxID=2483200 RepID=A0AAD7UQH9_9STRA|nr:hypothetical protein CTAYLR_002146 [Chrysophaeum taylorii]
MTKCDNRQPACARRDQRQVAAVRARGGAPPQKFEATLKRLGWAHSYSFYDEADKNRDGVPKEAKLIIDEDKRGRTVTIDVGVNDMGPTIACKNSGIRMRVMGGSTAEYEPIPFDYGRFSVRAAPTSKRPREDETDETASPRSRRPADVC